MRFLVKNQDKDVILFDGVCNLCNSSVDFVLRHDTKKAFLFASLQSDAGKELLEKAGLEESYLDSIVLYSEGSVYVGADAALRIAAKLRFPFNLLTVGRLIPGPLRTMVYNYIARNRYRWFGKQDSCRLPTPEEKERFIE